MCKKVEISQVKWIIILTFSVYLIVTGLHNMDVGQNMRLEECRTNNKMKDITSIGIELSPTTGYIIGYDMVVLGIFILIISSINIGRKVGINGKN